MANGGNGDDEKLIEVLRKIGEAVRQRGALEKPCLASAENRDNVVDVKVNVAEVALADVGAIARRADLLEVVWRDLVARTSRSDVTLYDVLDVLVELYLECRLDVECSQLLQKVIRKVIYKQLVY